VDRTTSKIQDLYIRICRDSKFQLEWERVTQIMAKVLDITPMMVYLAFPYLVRMKSIARRVDPVLKVDA